jgi:hypothetical protein
MYIHTLVVQSKIQLTAVTSDRPCVMVAVTFTYCQKVDIVKLVAM